MITKEVDFKVDRTNTVGRFVTISGIVVSDDRSRSQLGIDNGSAKYSDIYIIPVGLKVCTVCRDDAPDIARSLMEFFADLGDDSAVHKGPLKRPGDNDLISKYSSLIISLGAKLPYAAKIEQDLFEDNKSAGLIVKE